MSKTDSEVTFDSETRFTGQVKWFNNKAGFGFLTVCVSPDDSFLGQDIFVHHTSLSVSTEQYKYLVQGEYVDFNLKNSDSNDHPYQAHDITGVSRGKLMCETRWEVRQARETASEGTDGRQGSQRSQRTQRRRVRPRGSGPRDEEGWSSSSSSRRPPSKKATVNDE